jgi:hypothetical protein
MIENVKQQACIHTHHDHVGHVMDTHFFHDASFSFAKCGVSPQFVFNEFHLDFDPTFRFLGGFVMPSSRAASARQIQVVRVRVRYILHF